MGKRSKKKKPQPRPNFELVLDLNSLGYQRIIGLDEVGRGALAGPLVVAAIELNIKILGVDDSKNLSSKKRELLAAKIKKNCKQISIGQVSSKEIDQLGLSKAQRLAYERALSQVNGDIFLTDYYSINNRPFIKAVKGDRLFYPVAAASIVAKVFRDKLMQNLSQEFSDYSWDKNVGYGTKKHLEVIKKIGLTPHHRKSFIKKIQPEYKYSG